MEWSGNFSLVQQIHQYFLIFKNADKREHSNIFHKLWKFLHQSELIF